MAKTILIDSDLWLGDFWETVGDIVTGLAKTWDLPNDVVDERLDEIIEVVVQQSSHKLLVDMHTTWKHADNTFAVEISAPDAARDIEKIANSERSFISFTPEGVTLSKHRDDESFIPMRSLTETLDKIIREYIETSVFLVLGSIRADIQNAKP